MPATKQQPIVAASAASPVKGRQLPADPAKLTLKQVRDAIPAHYFQQNTMKSIYFLCRDLVQIAATGYITHEYVLPGVAAFNAAYLAGLPVVAALVTFAVYNLYWWVQGLNMTGVWVLAHECGHRAFSSSTLVNDAFGLVLHSALLVPYHSWRISHGNHHKNTNHLELDTVFVPEKVSPQQAAMREAFKESPIASVAWIVVMLTLGWPGYLIGNMTGQRYSRRANHFEPSSPLFRTNQRTDIYVSDLGLVAAFAAIAYAVAEFGAANVAFWYGVPYLWVNAWLVFITYLQHSDVRIPHYSPDNWNFLRGALSTVDRDFGGAINWWLHHIQDSHVVHHLFSTMPFFNAIEVTRKHIKPILGEYYVEDHRPLRTSLWESWTNCRYVVPQEGIAYFKR